MQIRKGEYRFDIRSQMSGERELSCCCSNKAEGQNAFRRSSHIEEDMLSIPFSVEFTGPRGLKKLWPRKIWACKIGCLWTKCSFLVECLFVGLSTRGIYVG